MLVLVGDNTAVSRPRDGVAHCTHVAGYDHLCDLAEPVRICADLSAGSDRYEVSVRIFTPYERQLHAVLRYFEVVAASGHAGFFAPNTILLFQDAQDGLMAIGAHDCADLLQLAQSRLAGTALAVGTRSRAQVRPDFADLDLALNRDAALKAALSFALRHRDKFANA